MKGALIGAVVGLFIGQVILVAMGAYDQNTGLHLDSILLITGFFLLFGAIIGSPKSKTTNGLDGVEHPFTRLPHNPGFDDGSPEGRSQHGYHSRRDEPNRWD